MSDETMYGLQLHRARKYIDMEIDRYNDLQGTFIAEGLGDDAFASGVIHGLMKARTAMFTADERAESERVRREMFG